MRPHLSTNHLISSGSGDHPTRKRNRRLVSRRRSGLSPREQRMLSRKAADTSAGVDAWIAQIEQMTLEELATFQSRIGAGRVTPNQVRTIDRCHPRTVES